MCFPLGAHLLYKGWYASNTPVWQNLVRCVKSLKIFLLKTIFWRASNASELDDISSFVFTCCLVRDGWTHFATSPFMFVLDLKQNTYPFLTRSSGSPSHVADAHQKWFPIDLIHFSIIVQADLLLTARNFFLMFLAKCHTSKCSQKQQFHFFLFSKNDFLLTHSFKDWILQLFLCPSKKFFVV